MKQTNHGGMRTAGLALLGALLTVSAVAGAFPYQRRVAVCVGVNAYESYPNLNCAVNDAVSMARVLESFGFDEVVLLTDEEATRGAIEAAFEGVGGRMGAEDLLVVFYAGHGWTGNGAEGTMGYVLPVETRKGHEAEDGLSMLRLREMATAMPNRHTLFLMDACYSGFGIQVKSDSINDATRSIQMLTAGGELDRAFEADGHGLFTRHILSYFRNSERGAGQVSALKLASFVHRKVKGETSGWQTPRFGRMGDDSDIVIAMDAAGADNKVAMAR